MMRLLLCLLVCLLSLLAGAAWAAEPLAVQVGPLVVTPAHLPPVVVTIRNRQATPLQGAVRLNLPDGWTYRPEQLPLTLAANETQRLVFTVTRGTTSAENRYRIGVVVEAGNVSANYERDVVCASAPYFKPTIDGLADEWDDAIPLSFVVGGKRTEVRTYWNRRQLSLLVTVEEDRLVLPDARDAKGPFDAVQLAIAPQESVTPRSADAEATRVELLLVGAADGGGRSYLLAEPGIAIGQTQQIRPLETLSADDVLLAVRRDSRRTRYECGIPFRRLRSIRPSEGREFCMSLLVHDPDGVGIRDLGHAAGLWPEQRNRMAWSRFPGDHWQDTIPQDNKLPWGLCSSKY